LARRIPFSSDFLSKEIGGEIGPATVLTVAIEETQAMGSFNWPWHAAEHRLEGTQPDHEFFCYFARGFGSCAVEWRKGALIYAPNIMPLEARMLRREGEESRADRIEAAFSRLVATNPRHAIQEVRPGLEEWQRFWSVVDRLNVWDWQGDYSEDALCGTPWHLEMQRHGNSMSCSGNRGISAPPGFDQFYEAMMRLVGQDT
jgi:hypothetical protein